MQDWLPIKDAPRGQALQLKGPGYETKGLFDPERNAWCDMQAPHFLLPFGPSYQPTHFRVTDAGETSPR